MKQGWEYKKLGECFPYIKNGANIKQIKNADGIPITRIETLSGGVFNRDRMGYAGIHVLDKYNDYVLEDGDLLMSHINSKTYIGRTVEYKKDGNETIIHGMNLLRLKSNNSLIVSSFMAYYTLSAEFKANVAKIRKDAVNQSSMAISDLKKFQIPLPSLSIQQSIVAELDEINNLIQLKKKELETFDKLAQSIFYEMFGDPVTNEKGWEVKKWNDVFNTRTGKLDSNAAVENGEYPFFTCAKTPFAIDVYAFDCEALLLAGNNASADYDVKYYKGKFNAYQRTYVLTLKDRLQNYQLLKFQLENRLVELKHKSLGINTKYLTLKILAGLQFILPPLPLQQTFANRIEAIEQQKEQVKAAIEKLETLLASRMQYWFD